MKKFIVSLSIFTLLFSSTSQVFATNQVSQMATTKGGKQVAECAQKMDKGVSECAKQISCEKEM